MSDKTDTSDSEYSIFNHTDRELIVATDDGGAKQFRLLGQCVSPLDERPRLLWAASRGEIDGARWWKIEPGSDVHVSETGAEASLGAGSPIVRDVGEATRGLHIAGLGTSALPGEPPGTIATEAWFYRPDEIWVTVLGAGITGLTAAHELVTRGFRVQVIERAHGSPVDAVDGDTGVARFHRGLTTPDVGGVARTQWATQPLPRGGVTGRSPSRESRMVPELTSEGPESLHSVHGDAIWFGAGAGGPQTMGQYHAFGVTWTGDQIDEFAAPLEAWLRQAGVDRSLAAVQLVVVVYAGSDAEDVRRGYRRLRELLDRLDPREPRPAAVQSLCDALDRLQVLPTARIDVPEQEPMGPYVGLIVRVHEDLALIAGEHGFRFFPGFYRHLRDTMRRTPIFDPVTQTFTPRTALDNLQEVAWQVIADPTRTDNTPLSRKPFTTISGLIEQYLVLRRGLGYRPIDLLRFVLRLLRYATSSNRRRAACYETMSWWTFLSKPHLDDPRDEDAFEFGERFAQALRHTPKALVAMGAEYADARTQGNINVQLLMDEFGLHDQGDSTLSGPTSTSWLSHWRTYLEEQGVRFFLGEVTRIEPRVPAAPGIQREVRAGVDFVWPDGAMPAEYLDGEVMRSAGRIYDHYIVSALDVVGLARVSRGLRRERAGVLSDLDHLVGDDGGSDRDLEDITTIGQVGPGDGAGDRFQTLTGIQLYYQRHVSFSNGHIYFAASPWGLSAISQVQYWGPFGSGHRGRLTGNLSVDIGAWRNDGRAPSPNRLDRDAIAAEVQAQIAGGSSYATGGPQTGARFYHLDDFIGFSATSGEDGKLVVVPARNHAPFLINVTGEWQRRPRGEPWSPNDRSMRDRPPGSGTMDGAVWTPERGGYVMHWDNLVVAGTHMRTYTRMVTMEAANESARHAVNTVLDHATWVLRGRTSPDRRAFEVPRIGANVDKVPTPFGDYCDIWNPERFEFGDLEFLRAIDDHLMDAGARTRDDDAPACSVERPPPHLFDILRIDELPDLLEDDPDAVNALELVRSVIQAFDGARVDDLPGMLAVVERARGKLTDLMQRATGRAGHGAKRGA